MIQNKKQFFTDEFYSNPELTLDIMNKLLDEEYLDSKDMYESGSFLMMDVKDTEETRQILAPIISNMESYIQYNNNGWLTPKDEEIIGLSGLHDEHYKVNHRDGNEIMWCKDREQFLFACDLEYDF